ncbi:MAG: PKD domain-containing protein [Candidatus Thermoplasmatota archaeon]|nr:PKD domain-containing protein [Candidatus Thermoplasmatota archaeon]
MKRFIWRSQVRNGHPDKPLLDGPASGKPKKEYKLSIVSTDPDEDMIYYYIDWGDGRNTGWAGPYSSGEAVVFSHTWSKIGKYNVKARANDTNGLTSPWTEFLVTMPRNKFSYETSFLQFLKHFPVFSDLMKYLSKIF